MTPRFCLPTLHVRVIPPCALLPKAGLCAWHVCVCISVCVCMHAPWLAYGETDQTLHCTASQGSWLCFHHAWQSTEPAETLCCVSWSPRTHNAEQGTGGVVWLVRVCLCVMPMQDAGTNPVQPIDRHSANAHRPPLPLTHCPHSKGHTLTL